jgi:phospholipid/cholesterol/gamma-HCH transport system ATP-binding protein
VIADAPHPDAARDVHLRVRGLRKSYGDHEVLKDISFDVFRGLTNVIIGASGSGKTVLLRQLTRLERPDAGRIELDGEDIAALDEVELSRSRHKFAMVFQDAALFDSMDVFDNIAFPLREHRRDLSRHEIARRVEEQLTALGITAAIHKLPAELSGGMKKRVAVARALVMEPEILIYDEPTRGLDPILSRTVDQLIESTRQRLGVTSILISHDMRSVLSVAQQVNMLIDGTIAVSLSIEDFMRSQDPTVQKFLKASGVSFTAKRR